MQGPENHNTQTMGILLDNSMLRFGLFRLLGVLLPLYAFSVNAEGYCVACYSPDAVYQCLIEGSKNTSSIDPRHQVLCIKLIAKDGGHSRCSVERFTNIGCKGVVKFVDADTSTLKSSKVAGTAPSVAPNQSSSSVAGSTSGSGEQKKSPDSEQQVAEGEKNSEPTIENLTKSSVQTTKNGLEVVSGVIKETTSKTGEKILSFANTLGHATKKTWMCVTSFFSDC